MVNSVLQGMHILLIEDDVSISEVVTTFLNKKGFTCTQAFSGSEARLLFLQGAAYDLVITDLMLPGLSGQEIVTLVRSNKHTPIIVISALDTPAQKVGLFELGADDYLVKPFDLEELYARVLVQVRHAQRSGGRHISGGVWPSAHEEVFDKEGSRASASSDAMLARDRIIHKEWVLKTESRQLESAGKAVKLTRLEYNIVETLMRRPTKVFTKQELFKLAWSEDCYIEEKAINVHISNIRSKLKETGTEEYIETVWGVGFKLADA